MSEPVYDRDLKETLAHNRLLGLWRLMGGYRLAYLGATLALALAAATKTGTYLLLRFFIDQVLGQGYGGTAILPLVAAGFIGLALLEGLFTFVSGRLAAGTAEGIARRLRNYLFDHIQRLTFTYHDETKTGELVQRSTSDVDAVRRFFAEQATGFGRILMLFSINFIALLVLNWKLALISIIVVPPVLLVSLFFFKRISVAYEAFQSQEGAVSSSLQENLAGVRVVKAFARQEFERQRFEQGNRELWRRGRRLILMHGAYWPLTDILCGAQMLGGLLVAATMTINGTITLGSFLAYAGMVVWIIWPMRNLGRLIVQMSQGLVSYGRLVEVIREPREPLSEGSYTPAGDLRGEVVFEQVHFAYEAGGQVLKDISLRCEPGQVIALLGATGSGKTSLVNLLPRFYDYTSGSIRLDGIELRNYPRQFLRRQIGIIEQEAFLFSRSIRENIAYGVDREVPQAEIEAAARAAQAHTFITSFPDGYNTLVGERGVTLSGGQKQRIAIARTLLKNPRILIMDDSTSAVDTETEAEIRMALEQLMQSRTTFIIAHRISSMLNADLILVLDQGRIVQRGTHDQLVAQQGIYQRIYELQTRIELELEKEMTDVGLSV